MGEGGSNNYTNLQCGLGSLTGDKLLQSFQAQYSFLEKKRQELANAEKLFDLPITKYDALIEVDMDLRNMTKVYELYKAQKVIKGASIISIII